MDFRFTPEREALRVEFTEFCKEEVKEKRLINKKNQSQYVLIKKENVMKRRHVFLRMITLVSVMILLGSIPSYAEEVRGVTDGTIKIGTIGDLTGPAADVWHGIISGIRTYIQFINDQGGIHGRKIKIITEDDRYSSPLALAAFKKLVYNDKVFAFSGAASAVGPTRAIIPLIEKEKIPSIAVTNDVAYFTPARKYIFTALPFYEDQIKVLFDYLWNDLKVDRPKITLVYMESPSSIPVLHLVRNLVKKYNASLSEVIIPVAGLDMTSQVLLLKSARPDYVIIHGYLANTAAVLRDAKKFGFNSQIIAMQYAVVGKLIEMTRSAANGLMGINGLGSPIDNTPGMVQLRKIDKKYNPGSGYRDENYVQGWLISMILCEGLKNAGRNLNSETLVKGWEKIKNFDTQGICGVVNLAPDNHKVVNNSRIYKADVDNLRFVPITDWRGAKE